MNIKLAKPGFLTMICSVELLERFAYYGLTSLLIVFLTSNLSFSDTKAYATSSLFAAIGFAVPVIGGFLADKALGLRCLISIGATISMLGYGLICFFCENQTILTLGLALIAVGTGIFKGNLTILLGACYSSEEINKQDRGFTIFYICINLGILMSAIMCGYIAKKYGIKFGFAAASFGMVISFVVFTNYQRLLKNVGKTCISLSNSMLALKTWALVLSILAVLIACTTCGLYYSARIAGIIGCCAITLCAYYIFVVFRTNQKEKAKLFILLLIIPFLTVFYSLQSQLYFAINLFTARNLNTEIFGHLVPNTAFQSIAPGAAILTGLFLSRILGRNAKKTNNTNGFIRFGVGLVGPFFCFSLLYFGCCRAVAGMVSCVYLLSLCFIGAAESLIGPFAYHQATILAPAKMKGYAMSIVLMAIAFGNLSTILISKFMSIETLESLDCAKSLIIYKNGFFNLAIIQAILCLCFFCIYFILRKHINRICNTDKDQREQSIVKHQS
jgi:proton-dependent oligopeptide transporter, POT family